MNDHHPDYQVPPPPPRRYLMYAPRSPSSSDCDHDSVGTEPDASANCDDEHEPPLGRESDGGSYQEALTEDDLVDTPYGDFWGEKQIVAPAKIFEGDRTDHRYAIARLGECRHGVALKYFRGRYSASNWMCDQDGWLKNASLLASAEDFTFDPCRVLYCSRHGKLCGQPYFCYRCNVDQRVEPTQKMFANAFPKRPHWNSIVLNYEMSAEQAGIWTGLGDDCRAIHLPHQGEADGRFLQCCPNRLTGAKMLCDLLFKVVKCLKKAGAIDGWLAVVESSLSFWPAPCSRFHLWSGIEHGFLPHVHVLASGWHPFVNTLLKAIYDALQHFLGDWSYANFWFNPVTSQEEITKWINYCIKPFPLAKWHSNALRAGCDRSNLNLLFDEVALQSCPGIMSRIYSPRRGGVFATNSGDDDCIIEPVPPLLTRKQFTQCGDEKFYHEHESSFWRTLEKRALRQGRSFRCRTQNHQGAIRRIAAWKKRQQEE